MKAEVHGKVQVYFCGSASLEQVVKKHSENMGFIFSNSFWAKI